LEQANNDVQSLYGMNVDILQNPSPSWTTYFYIAVPVFLLLMASVLVIKYGLKIAKLRFLVIDYGRKITKLSVLGIKHGRKIAKLFEKTKVFDEEYGGPAVSQPFGKSSSTAKSRKYRHPNEKQAYIQLLCDSIKTGNTAVAEWLIIPKIPLDNQNDDGWTALQLAARHGQIGVMEKLLQHGADINASPSRGEGVRTALQAAAGAGHLEIVNRLLEVKADVNAKPAETGGRTALQAAAESGHLYTVLCLLDAGADINALSTWMGKRVARSSSLCLAEANGHVDVTNLLRTRGAKEREQLVKEGAIDE
jgi:hypothetical protein